MLIRIKASTSIIYFEKKVCMGINQMQNFLKWMFVYYKCYVFIEFTFPKNRHYLSLWYFLNKGFRCQPDVCDGCHDLLMISMNLSDIVIANSKGSDYRWIISGINRNVAINVTQNIYFTEKSGTL